VPAADPTPPPGLTIDALASVTGTTTRNIRSFQTLGLLDHPILRGRTGLYTSAHLERLTSILRLQSKGFSLQSLSLLFAAHQRGEALDSVLGLGAGSGSNETDEAELYGFVEFQRNSRAHVQRPGRPLLSIVPTTVWDNTEAS
jgi:DNA-binding transcriptional MerR regulator